MDRHMIKVMRLFFVLFLSFSIAGVDLYSSSISSSNEKPLYTIYIFVSESCPICQQITLNWKELMARYSSDSVQFVMIFPNNRESTKESIENFKEKYNLHCESVVDKGQKWTRKFKASITPEVILWDNQRNSILYRGKLDNQYETLGKKRSVVTEKYVADALENVLYGTKSIPANTEPIGCFIIK